jgi:hypothetical protein
MADSDDGPEVGIGIFVFLFVFSLRHVQLVPEGKESSVSLGFSGSKKNSVINHEGLKGHQWEIKSNNGQDSAKENTVGGKELANPIIPLGSRQTGIKILVNCHEDSLVVSDVLVVVQDKLVQQLVVSVDNLKRQLGVGMVNSVVNNCVRSTEAHEPQG